MGAKSQSVKSRLGGGSQEGFWGEVSQLKWDLKDDWGKKKGGMF